MKNDNALRRHVLELLAGGHARVDLKTPLAGLPPRLRGKKPKGADHTAWQLLEHIRIAQWDILEFSRNPKHVSPKWPDEYWPKGDGLPRPGDWNRSIRQVGADAKGRRNLIADPKKDLLAPLPHGEGQTLLRE